MNRSTARLERRRVQVKGRRRVAAAVAGLLVGAGALGVVVSLKHSDQPAPAASSMATVTLVPTVTDIGPIDRAVTGVVGADWVVMNRPLSDGRVRLLVVPVSGRAQDATAIAAALTRDRVGKATVGSSPTVTATYTVKAKPAGFTSDPTRGRSIPGPVQDVLRRAAPAGGWTISGRAGRWTLTVIDIAPAHPQQRIAQLTAAAPAVAKAAHVNARDVSVRTSGPTA